MEGEAQCGWPGVLERTVSGYTEISGWGDPNRGNSKCKGPEAEWIWDVGQMTRRPLLLKQVRRDGVGRGLGQIEAGGTSCGTLASWKGSEQRGHLI